MFFHNLKYEIILNLRAKEVIIWMLAFPIVLSVLYKAAFGNIYENGGITTVPVAIVENEPDEMFRAMVDFMGESESTYAQDESNIGSWLSKTMQQKEQDDPQQKPLLHAIYCGEDEAYRMLEAGDVKGIIFVDAPEGTDVSGENAKAGDADAADSITSDEVTAEWSAEAIKSFLDAFDGSERYQNADAETILAGEGLSLQDAASFKDMLDQKPKLSLKIKSSGMEQSTLKRFLETYGSLTSISGKLADQGGTGTSSSSIMDSDLIEVRKLTEGNTDPFVTYMYNMIAMVALFGMTVALHVALFSEANLSDYGARRSCSPTPKLTTIMSGLCGCYFTQILCVAVCITFQAFVLKVDFGGRLPFVYLGGALGAIMGVSMGFFVGAIGRLKYEAKIGISMAVVMGLSFMSGLMFTGIKAAIEMSAPIINDLNPVAIIADSFYYLSVDPDLSRYWGKLAVAGIYTVIFILLGFLMTRRRKYESL